MTSIEKFSSLLDKRIKNARKREQYVEMELKIFICKKCGEHFLRRGEVEEHIKQCKK